MPSAHPQTLTAHDWVRPAIEWAKQATDEAEPRIRNRLRLGHGGEMMRSRMYAYDGFVLFLDVSENVPNGPL